MLEVLTDPVVHFWLFVGLVLLVVALGWAFALLSPVIVGAVLIFHSAREWGILGIAVYAACWFFMFPLMLVGSLAVGLFFLWTERQAEKRAPESLIETRPASYRGATPYELSKRQPNR